MPKVEETVMFKNSARPKYQTQLAQTAGTNAIRKIPESRFPVETSRLYGANSTDQIPPPKPPNKKMDDESPKKRTKTEKKPRLNLTNINVIPPNKRTGFNRFDDQRPAAYITEHLCMNPMLELQTTLISSPQTSWEKRLPDRPFAGKNVPQDVTAADVPNKPQTRWRGAYEEWGRTIETYCNPAEEVPKVPTKEKKERVDVPVVHDLSMKRVYQPMGGWDVAGHMQVYDKPFPRSASQPTLKERASYEGRMGHRQYGSRGIWGHLQAKYDHRDWVKERRDWFQNYRRSDYIFPDGIDRRTGMLTTTELKVRSQSEGRPFQQGSLWPHRLPWLHDSPQKQFGTIKYNCLLVDA